MRILIADDHGIVRGGLKLLIERQPDMEVVAEAEDGVDAFEQARGDTAATFGGTGLGLAISKAFAELLGYRIVVRSVEGAGSTFSVVLHADAPLPVHTGTPPR